ncbi:P2RX7-like protein [Mya arenaria]|uniref:P2RX7-like protein n=1 Tax=Mya arenaria TaxID=6604 RepID=A0ABY7DPE3_MYAAR|nr:P2RX7-like protein [Mya arenaria]
MNDLIDKLTEAEAKTLLKTLETKRPTIILDAYNSIKRTDPEPDRPSAEVQGWCKCTHCPEMDRELDRVCCNMRPEHCISLRTEMSLVTDTLVLNIQGPMNKGIYVHDAALEQTQDELNQKLRQGAYRQCNLWIHGHLGPRIRKNVPACCVQVIRDKFPDSAGKYTGFIPLE